MHYYDMPDWSGPVRNLYWFLRYRRQWNSAARRRYYRKIRVERDRLVASGIDAEWVRLFCRWQSNLGGPAFRRLDAYERENGHSWHKRGARTYPALDDVLPC